MNETACREAEGKAYPGVDIEFLLEVPGAGPGKHLMRSEPGGIRIEFIWPGCSPVASLCFI